LTTLDEAHSALQATLRSGLTLHVFCPPLRDVQGIDERRARLTALPTRGGSSVG